MDHRIRWRQRRLEKRRQRLLAIPLGLALGLGLYLLLQGLGGQTSVWVHQGAPRLTPHFALGAAALYAVWPDGHVEAVRLNDGGLHGGGPLVSVPEPFNSPPVYGRRTLYFGSDLGLLRAVDSKTGDRLWKFNTGGALRGQPLLEDRRLYVGSDSGQVHCLVVGTGQPAWTTDLGSPIAQAVARVGDMLVVATTAGTVYGLDAGNGRKRWERPLGEPSFAPVTAADPLVVIGTDRGTAWFLEAATGQVVSHYSTRGLIRTAAAVCPQGICFASSDGWLRTVTRDGLRPLWVHHLGGPVSVGPVVAGTRLFAGAPGRLVALEVGRGRPLRVWEGEAFAGDLVATTDTVYAGTNTGRILALTSP